MKLQARKRPWAASRIDPARTRRPGTRGQGLHPSGCNSRPSALLPGLVYFHGGGLVAGTVDTHDSIARALSQSRRVPGGFGRLPAGARTSLPGRARRRSGGGHCISVLTPPISASTPRASASAAIPPGPRSRRRRPRPSPGSAARAWPCKLLICPILDYSRIHPLQARAGTRLSGRSGHARSRPPVLRAAGNQSGRPADFAAARPGCRGAAAHPDSHGGIRSAARRRPGLFRAPYPRAHGSVLHLPPGYDSSFLRPGRRNSVCPNRVHTDRR